ncbi:isoaspartyl peptidase [Marivirga tractuosa]|uniref:Isoaspartyl peptidase n=1 Tax=Marivirga tractuosa (strain ATCC 23168 / DSM 4126 / NBRC 15989 / NCIMB 1408 / VKM B-1430 / H-43) TaxID=643867 RepID=E4TPG9_MARTH|nr:isoaspartyl peptidase/L-asparaginase [Marivirga tractuosa]ADR21557.1 peptidase T2 asparaginase 2 [Marivirga tractuosa DSM 4126]BDD13988.1 isoaspartyl peptidase [Marivirga tractuosa]
MKKFVLAIHGGAGTILKKNMTPEKEEAYHEALREALEAGEDILNKKGTAIEAVAVAVSAMEDSPLFNAGKGSVYSNSGKNEMEASIMEGAKLRAGAIAGVRNIKNPIQLAKSILFDDDFVYLIGKGAEEYGDNRKLEKAADEYFQTRFREEQWLAAKGEGKVLLDHDADKKFGTVGAVALDIDGNLAAATSTGGLTNKKYGRIGDSSVIGSGTYANNNTCAISCTGYGEFFLRAIVAYDVSCLMEYKGLSLKDACEQVVMKKLVAMKGEGGLIALDAAGNYDFSFNSEGMYRGVVGSDLALKTYIYK